MANTAGSRGSAGMCSLEMRCGGAGSQASSEVRISEVHGTRADVGEDFPHRVTDPPCKGTVQKGEGECLQWRGVSADQTPRSHSKPSSVDPGRGRGCAFLELDHGR